jgi:hypothetical protein
VEVDLVRVTTAYVLRYKPCKVLFFHYINALKGTFYFQVKKMNSTSFIDLKNSASHKVSIEKIVRETGGCCHAGAVPIVENSDEVKVVFSYGDELLLQMKWSENA